MMADDLRTMMEAIYPKERVAAAWAKFSADNPVDWGKVMPAESGMIRRLRAWSEAESEKQRELAYCRSQAAQAQQNSYYQSEVMAQNARMAQQAQDIWWPNPNDLRPCSELELLKLAALFGLGDKRNKRNE